MGNLVLLNDPLSCEDAGRGCAQAAAGAAPPINLDTIDEGSPESATGDLSAPSEEESDAWPTRPEKGAGGGKEMAGAAGRWGEPHRHPKQEETKDGRNGAAEKER